MIVLHLATVAMDTSDCLACGHCCHGYQLVSCRWPLLPWTPMIVLHVATVGMDTSDDLTCVCACVRVRACVTGEQQQA